MFDCFIYVCTFIFFFCINCVHIVVIDCGNSLHTNMIIGNMFYADKSNVITCFLQHNYNIIYHKNIDQYIK